MWHGGMRAGGWGDPGGYRLLMQKRWHAQRLVASEVGRRAGEARARRSLEVDQDGPTLLARHLKGKQEEVSARFVGALGGARARFGLTCINTKSLEADDLVQQAGI